MRTKRTHAASTPLRGRRRLTTLALLTVLAALVGLLDRAGASVQGIRVVDAVTVADEREEASHGLAGEEMTTGESEGRRWRSAAGWFSYVLRIYGDTPLTIVCTVADTGDAREAFDVLADDRKVATRVREPGASSPRVFKLGVPPAITEGRETVTVTFRAHAGFQTARLIDVRTVQEHLE